jgi:PAS domain S-box-containing protein
MPDGVTQDPRDGEAKYRQLYEHAQRVHESEERFRILVESVKEYAIFLVDATGHVATWNTGARRLKGYEEREIVGKHISTFYTAEDIARGHPAEVLAHAAEEGKHEEEGWRVRKDGSRFWASLHLTALREADGTLRGFAKITRDFTERRQAADALLEKQAQLTASLKEREVLLQEVHHRVKNNLQVISSLINMQSRQLKDPSVRAALSECKTRVQTIALIHETLYKSQDYARVPFREYARSLAANIFQVMTTAGKVELHVDIAEDVVLPVDKAIPCGLILNELITNALKHAFRLSRSGSLRFTMRGGAEIFLCVQDDGPGMPARFELAKSKSLGLQLVTTLVEQLDGQLEITGGGGTAFRVSFPLEGKP